MDSTQNEFLVERCTWTSAIWEIVIVAQEVVGVDSENCRRKSARKG